MTAFKVRAVVHDFPFGGPSQGQTITFFEPIGPFGIRGMGKRRGFRVTDSRRTNPKGGPDHGVIFRTQREVIAHITANA